MGERGGCCEGVIAGEEVLAGRTREGRTLDRESRQGAPTAVGAKRRGVCAAVAGEEGFCLEHATW